MTPYLQVTCKLCKDNPPIASVYHNTIQDWASVSSIVELHYNFHHREITP